MGSQLQNFDPSAFAENPLLCGIPLQRMCDQEKEKGSVQQTGLGNQDHEGGLVTRGFYISMGLGFAFGFCVVSGTLMFHESGRST
ncbi:receptor kinase-like protein Xa21 isoform X2 [Prunus yedoensis var. nudiflora]|uniref:Receptor kinase-like protein Xa21 isoform X2 n=1 Tax=Prunus yedoensis var. nudiflora TaxID=2094558 RepID=A0A314YUD1_PRUYE|nr:receptor kinase-like protein Xa21 isoform X2 [Prunus yedoensis var. nudiflora]